MNLRQVITRGTAGVTAGFAALVVLAPVAHSDTPPFSDPNSVGSIGLCDQSGKPITSGSTTDKPFAWTAVSSVPSPTGYTIADRGKASLFAFQPRQYTDPAEWTGSQLTAGSVFSTDVHPMAATTSLDPTLADTLAAFPAYWDGYYELRMFFGAPQKQQLTTSYPAAVIKISGTQWTLVSGGTTACGSGTAVSTEKAFLPAASFSTQPAGSSSTSASPAGGQTSGTTGSPTPVTGRTTPAIGQTTSSVGGSTSHGASLAPNAADTGGARPTPSVSAPGTGGATASGAKIASGSATSESTNSAASGTTLKSTEASSRSTSSSLPGLLLGSLAVLVVIAGSVLWWARRRA